ncbi:MAG TPA: nitroreductase family protein [Nitrososphaerales archaeon]|nr:nitroreductase family protein [Nitrososphaerales archaeon]
MPGIELTPDELLTTTRAVRKRLDLARPVERNVIEECVAIAQQAPNGSNLQRWHFVVVTDPEKRRALGEFYRKGAEDYFANPPAPAGGLNATNQDATYRLRKSALFLVEHIHEVPVHVIPCISPRTDGLPGSRQASTWASILPATWSFMLALRSRGLGSAFTTFHLKSEEEAARLLGIPFGQVMQAGLVPVAYAKGAVFKPAPREPVSSMLHWDHW